MRNKGIGGHQLPNQGMTNEWLTPPEIVKSLGDFDLDPCAPLNRPWDTAKKHYTIDDDGLNQEWKGRVWLNPPYGAEISKWLCKLSNHGNGMTLIFARTETKFFFDYVWDKANALFFFKGRLYFHHSNGEKAKNNAGAPSVLVAYGKNNVEILENSNIKNGILVKIR
jgi:hypothetical protein